MRWMVVVHDDDGDDGDRSLWEMIRDRLLTDCGDHHDHYHSHHHHR